MSSQPSDVKVIYSAAKEPRAVVICSKHDDDDKPPRILQAKSVYHFLHATHPQAAKFKSILAEHVIVPSFFDSEHPDWLPPFGFYARDRRQQSNYLWTVCFPSRWSANAFVAICGHESVNSIMIGGLAYCRQADHCTVHYGLMAAEIAAGY